jgi:hypothetical protein
MKYFYNIFLLFCFNFKKHILLLCVPLFVLMYKPGAQVVSLNGIYVSTGSGTVVNMDTLRNDNTSIFANAGTINLASIINAATIQGNGTYNISYLFTNTGTFTANSSTVHFNGSSNQNFPALTYNNLTASGSATTKTAIGNTVVNGTLTINSDVTMDMATYTLSGTLSAFAGSGTLNTQNTSSSPIPSGKIWNGLVNYNSSSAQNIVYGNYTDLTGSGGNRTIDSLGTVGIAGIFTPGAGAYAITSTTIDFNGDAAQTIPAFTFNNITVSGENTKTAGGTLNVRGNLTLGANTTLALGSNNINLKSDSTYTGRVATIPSTATITYDAGRFVAERYIKGRRKYRIMTSPVTTSPNTTLTTGEEGLSIWGNWQNQGNNSTPYVGTFITGGSSADGFDQQTQNSSLFTYNGATRLFEGFTTANGKNTKYTPLKAGVPYYMFVWGDRTNSPLTNSPYKTIFYTTGKILTGDQTYNTSSSIPLSNTVGGYTMIGNPFASPIDWGTVTRTNLSDTYWGWDPNLSSTGGYVTVSTTGTVTLISPFSGSVGLDQYIQSGQGFFVKTTTASPVLTIKESDKVNNFNGIAFRTYSNNIPLMAVNLLYDDVTGSTLMDGALAAFDDRFENEIGNEDASKILKSGEALAIELQSELLSIDARKMAEQGDTLLLNIARLSKPQYRLQIFAKQMENSTLEPYLEDSYLKTSRLLSLTDTNYITFTYNNSIAASYDVNRFQIVFRKSGVLSDVITSIKAEKQNRQVRVSWDVSSENGIQKYEIQRAEDGNGFTKIGEVIARAGAGVQHYEWMDINPVTGVNHYRIRLVKDDGSVFFSKTVTAILGEEKPELKIYPNPVQNYEFNVQFINLENGKYTARIINAKGQIVMDRLIDYDGGSANQWFRISRLNAAGVYFFLVSNGKVKLSQPIFIK